MKKIIFFLIAIIGLGFMFSCEKVTKDPVLDMSQANPPAITNPANGASFVFTEDMAEEMFMVSWEPVVYNLDNLALTNYSIMAYPADSAASTAKEWQSTTESSVSVTIGSMNNFLLGLGVASGNPADVKFYIRSYINSGTDETDLMSDMITLNFTTYQTVVVQKNIYLLGEATPVGWDNTLALPMANIGGGKFARVETLDPGVGSFFKFISVLGFWAPQWGTDETGTGEAGPLVYRPDEATPDPAAIPVPEEAGAYYIMADTVNLTYETFKTSGELFLVGNATTAGWDNTLGLPFTEVEPHIFEITTDLIEGGMKFLEVLGAWAPQWGTDDTATGESGPLIYRPSESVPDPAEVPSPGSGTFTITVDLTTLTYTIQAK
ncbi:MAG: SusF/SusE family outer membrane protein [Bacteroidetes bacterium]|nr:SusF/SusE family outer membrane protein [Bacteroidota bacterium]